MFTFVFILALIPICYIGYKIMTFKGLNIFDMIILFSLLYFWFIPCKDFIFEHAFPQLVGHTKTAISLCIYTWALMLGSYLCSVMFPRVNALNLSRLLLLINFRMKSHFLWIILAIGIFYFYNITNYSSLTAENPEANNQFQYGLGMPLFLRYIAICIRPIYPALIIIAYNTICVKPLYRRLRICCLFILILSLLLGVKTFLVFNLIFFGLYFYSRRRNSIKRKHILYSVAILFCVLIFLFPILQGFRIFKQYSVERNANHDFITVLTGFITQGVNEEIEKKVNRYQDRRSLNCYRTLDWACYDEYRGNGYLTWLIFRYTFPQRTLDDAGNIMGEKMARGGDVGESILAWFVLDYGHIFGPIVAIIYQVIICFLLYYFGLLFSLAFRTSSLMVIVAGYIAQQCINVEHNPTSDIRMFYAVYLFIFILIGLLFNYYAIRKYKKI